MEKHTPLGRQTDVQAHTLIKDSFLGQPAWQEPRDSAVAVCFFILLCLLILA